MLIFLHFISFLICVNGDDEVEKDNKIMVSYKNFILYSNSVFNDEPIDVSHATYEECLVKCKNVENCQSGNYVRDDHECSLFSGNKYATPSKFSSAPTGTDYFVMMSRGCETKKCQNKAVCIPNYRNNTYRCECKTGFYGQYCQFQEKEPYPDWWFKFDGDTINSGKSVNDVQVTPAHTYKGKAEFHGQPHRAGRYMHCHFKCTKSVISLAEWTEPDDSIAIALWIQLDKGESHRQREFHQQRSYIIDTEGKGYVISYSHEQKNWIFDLYRGEKIFYIQAAMDIEDTWKWNFVGMMWKDSKLFAVVNNSTFTAAKIYPVQRTLKPALPLFHPRNPCLYNIDDFRVWYGGFNEKYMRMIYLREREDIWI